MTAYRSHGQGIGKVQVTNKIEIVAAMRDGPLKGMVLTVYEVNQVLTLPIREPVRIVSSEEAEEMMRSWTPKSVQYHLHGFYAGRAVYGINPKKPQPTTDDQRRRYLGGE